MKNVFKLSVAEDRRTENIHWTEGLGQRVCTEDAEKEGGTEWRAREWEIQETRREEETAAAGEWETKREREREISWSWKAVWPTLGDEGMEERRRERFALRVNETYGSQASGKIMWIWLYQAVHIRPPKSKLKPTRIFIPLEYVSLLSFYICSDKYMHIEHSTSNSMAQTCRKQKNLYSLNSLHASRIMRTKRLQLKPTIIIVNWNVKKARMLINQVSFQAPQTHTPLKTISSKSKC